MGTSHRSARQGQGFTLIEIMITVVIVSVLAAIALPAFFGQVRKSRRADAIALISQVAQAEERFRANNPAFSNDFGTSMLNVRSTAASGVTSLNEIYYTISVNGHSATAYRVRAVATGSQVNDTQCVALEMRMTGGNASYFAGTSVATLADAATDANARRCWNR